MKYKLSEISRIVTGKTPSTKNKTSFSEEPDKYLFVTPRDMNGSEKTIKKTERYLTDEVTNTFKNLVINDKSICVSCIGTIGKVFMPSGPAITNQQINSITEIKNFVLPDYLYYYLTIHQKDIENLAGGTTMPIVNKTSFEQLEVEIPDLETQEKIVRILSALDQKIELNNLQNSTLFDSIRSIFRNKYYQKGNDCSLSDYILTEVNGDWGKDKKEDGTKEAYCIRGADIPDMEYGNKGNAPRRYILEKRLEKKSLFADDIIIEISGGSPTQSTGRTAYITKKILSMYDTRLLCTNFCKAIKVKDKVFAPFVYMYLKLLYEDGVMFNWENGTTGIKNLALSSLLSNMKVQSLNKDEARRFYDLFHSVIDKISGNSAENIILAQIRDTLLPKLLSGEIKPNGAV